MLGDSTITVKGQIKVKGQEPIQIDRRFSATNSANGGGLRLPRRWVRY